jgi:membrane protein
MNHFSPEPWSPVTLTDRVDAYQRRHARAGYPLAVLYKFFDDTGGHLAALIAYYAFLSLFPLLLLASTLLSVVLQGDPGAQHALLTSALRQFPVIGEQLGQPQQLSGGTAGVVIGSLGALYGGLGVALAGQSAMNTIWSVPRNNRPNPFKARGRALLLLATVGLAVLLTTGLSAIGGGAGAVGTGMRVLALAAAIVVNAGAFVVAFRLATARALSVRDVLPGAVAAALVWQLLQLFGKAFVTHTVKHASATNSLFALVLGLIAFLYLTALVVVLCAEANAVRVDRLYPRALLTPLTDNVVLTEGDERAYTDQAEAQRSKGFEQITVTFDRDA